MKTHCKYKGIKGFVKLYNNALRYQYMITKEALHKAKVLVFWEKHGLQATMDAFGTKRRTLFYWKKELKEGKGGTEALNPKTKRRRMWDYRILEEIKRIRKKENHLKDMGGLRTFPQKVTHFGKIKKANRQKVLRKPKDLKPSYPGHVLALDTIEKQRKGKRMYILTAIDIYARTTFAIATKSHSSQTFAHFFFLIMQMFPYEIKTVLTDNGSEFKKCLDQLLKQNNITHYHTYPKTPKMNAHCESFNGTIQEEFADYNINLLFDDTTAFNQKLKEYLIFYNTERVHYAFKNKMTPLEVLSNSKYYVSKLSILSAECKSGWGYAVVTPDGFLQKCFCLIGDKEYNFSHVSVVPTKYAQDIRFEAHNKRTIDCKNEKCAYLPICNGGCVRNSICLYGNSGFEKSHCCKTFLESVNIGLLKLNYSQELL